MDNEKLPTKERILIAALDLFAEYGYDGVGVDRIAEEAGIKGPAIYRYFKGKEDLQNNLIETMTIRYLENMSKAAGAMPDTIEELRNFSMNQVRYTVHAPVIVKLRKIIAGEQFRNPRYGMMATHFHLLRNMELFSSVIKRLIEKGVVIDDDPEMLALELTSPITLCIHMIDRDSTKEEEAMKLVSRHLDHWCKIYSV